MVVHPVIKPKVMMNCHRNTKVATHFKLTLCKHVHIWYQYFNKAEHLKSFKTIGVRCCTLDVFSKIALCVVLMFVGCFAMFRNKKCFFRSWTTSQQTMFQVHALTWTKTNWDSVRMSRPSVCPSGISVCPLISDISEYLRISQMLLWQYKVHYRRLILCIKSVSYISHSLQPIATANKI